MFCSLFIPCRNRRVDIRYLIGPINLLSTWGEVLFCRKKILIEFSSDGSGRGWVITRACRWFSCLIKFISLYWWFWGYKIVPSGCCLGWVFAVWVINLKCILQGEGCLTYNPLGDTCSTLGFGWWWWKGFYKVLSFLSNTPSVRFIWTFYTFCKVFWT